MNRILLRQIAVTVVTVTLMFGTVACGGKKPSETMSDSERLEVLDIKIKKKPKDADLLYERAKVYVNLERYNEAIADLEKATSLDDGKKEYFMLLGDTYFRLGRMDGSYSAIERVTQMDKNDREAWLKLGEIAFYSKDYDRAMDHLSQVTAADPNNRTALELKGFIYKETGDTAKAASYFRKLTNLYPDYPRAYEELGNEYADRGNPLALEYLATALRLDPSNTNVLYSLAMFYQNQGKMEKAEEHYTNLLDLDANNPYAWHNLGYIEMFHYGDYPQAIEYLKRAVECDPNYIEALANLACAYALNGNKSEAAEYYDKALAINPSFAPALEGKKDL